ncbi:hypothetical protein A2U01_0054022, partial [Trifolium medium]|nr:hypothetical protein [Trifolium medium]
MGDVAGRYTWQDMSGWCGADGAGSVTWHMACLGFFLCKDVKTENDAWSAYVPSAMARAAVKFRIL